MKMKLFFALTTIVLVFASTALAQKKTSELDARCWEKRDFSQDCAVQNARYTLKRMRATQSKVFAYLLYRFMRQGGTDGDQMGLSDSEKSFVLSAMTTFESGTVSDDCGRSVRKIGDDEISYTGIACKGDRMTHFTRRISFDTDD